LLSCSKNINIKPANTVGSLSLQNRAEVDDFKFQTLKENGIKSINEDQLTDGIKILEEAILIKEDEEIKKYLDDAYFERAEYYYSVGKVDEALEDLKKCTINNGNALSLLNKINISSKTTVNETVQETETSDKQTIDYTIAVGKDAILDSGGTGEEVFVALSKDDYNEMISLCVAGDSLGITEMENSGNLFLAEKGTKVKIIDMEIGKCKIRIYSGDYIGISGWVSREFVRTIKD
jgi:tetratricopeptide (TPR) repeat protein